MNLNQLTEEDLERMAEDIIKVSEGNKTEDELLKTLGLAINSSGLNSTSNKKTGAIEQQNYGLDASNFNMKDAVEMVSSADPINPESAKKLGGKFRENLRSIICNKPNLKKLLEGDGTLKDYLITGIPLVLLSLGLSALNPLHLVIIATVFAIIIKAGFATYCEIEA